MSGVGGVRGPTLIHKVVRLIYALVPNKTPHNSYTLYLKYTQTPTRNIF
jgi:hypothetical protein